MSVALTGLTNIGMTLGVQAFAGLSTLGAFALAYAPTMMGLTAQRLLLSQNLMRGAHVASVEFLPIAVVSLWVLSVGASIGVVVLIPGPTVFALIPVLCLFTLLQDFLRYMFLGANRSFHAFVADLTWFVLGIAGLGIAAVHQTGALQAVLLSQTFGAVVSTAMLFAARREIRARYPSGVAPVKPLFVEAVVISVLPYVSQYCIAFIIGIAVVGEFRSAQLLMVPVTMLATQAQAIIFPRLRPEDFSSVQRWAILCGLLAGSAGAIVVAVRWVDPWNVFDSLGFGDTRSFYVTTGLLVLGAVLSLYLMLYMVRIRIVLTKAVWLRWRLGAAFLEPTASIAAGLAVGTAGLAAGSLAANGTSAIGLLTHDLRGGRTGAAGRHRSRRAS
ncbi:hypothetical protein [Millisia brevis]|uniref:hypothetical protein n=1 Tax=Millisia brevis TaxID=264148 RepID=UPI000A469C0C|nr:hypothetical protein [Millisia brevis]